MAVTASDWLAPPKCLPFRPAEDQRWARPLRRHARHGTAGVHRSSLQPVSSGWDRFGPDIETRFAASVAKAPGLGQAGSGSGPVAGG